MDQVKEKPFPLDKNLMLTFFEPLDVKKYFFVNKKILNVKNQKKINLNTRKSILLLIIY